MIYAVLVGKDLPQPLLGYVLASLSMPVIGFAGMGDFSAVWTICGWQIAIQFIADFLTMGFDWKYHNIDVFSQWITNMPRFLLYCTPIMLGLSRCAHAMAWPLPS